jgi:uncharacterized protein YpmB
MKKENKIAIIVVVLLAIFIGGYFYYKKTVAPLAGEKTDSTPGIDPKIEYPSLRDLSGFDQGDVLTYKGKSFRANIDGGTWDLIS